MHIIEDGDLTPLPLFYSVPRHKAVFAPEIIHSGNLDLYRYCCPSPRWSRFPDGPGSEQSLPFPGGSSRLPIGSYQDSRFCFPHFARRKCPLNPLASPWSLDSDKGHNGPNKTLASDQLAGLSNHSYELEGLGGFQANLAPPSPGIYAKGFRRAGMRKHSLLGPIFPHGSEFLFQGL
jgi:hypothetical protein